MYIDHIPEPYASFDLKIPKDYTESEMNQLKEMFGEAFYDLILNQRKEELRPYKIDKILNR